MIIRLMDVDGREVHSIEKQIEGEEYDAWGTDDSYLEGLADKYVKEFLVGNQGSPTTPPSINTEIA